MNVSWKDKITNVESLCLAGLLSMADILIEKNLRRLGHTYQTLLKPRTVLVEPTDCHVDDIIGRSNHL
ncbi:unnamed protein product [Porites evermanni]|uniref:Uncharacterized protein n=1 Tax=Porites evermanni TaxID=104178 RepID=A0ABN8SZ43_9CNID|nr:unnamed protein product [Porites evermanni]